VVSLAALAYLVGIGSRTFRIVSRFLTSAAHELSSLLLGLIFLQAARPYIVKQCGPPAKAPPTAL
jgi:hypothetical protein